MENGNKLAIIINGRDPGLGTTTVRHGLVWVLYNSNVNVGTFAGSLRDIAGANGCPKDGDGFVRFLNSEYAKNIDLPWDNAQTKLMNRIDRDYVVVESKVGPLLKKEIRKLLQRLLKPRIKIDLDLNIDIPAKFICLTASKRTVVKRLRDTSRDSEVASVFDRRKNDSLRYKRVYGFDPYAMNVLNKSGAFILNTEKLSVTDTLQIILMNLFGLIDRFQNALDLLRVKELELGPNGDLKKWLIDENKNLVIDMKDAIEIVKTEMQSKGFSV